MKYFGAIQMEKSGEFTSEGVEMTYREMAIETLKLIGQELIDRAEELIPNTEGIKSIDV